MTAFHTLETEKEKVVAANILFYFILIAKLSFVR